MRTFASGFLLAGVVSLGTGCVEPHATYIPIYPAPTIHAGGSAYIYPSQILYQRTPGPTQPHADTEKPGTYPASPPPEGNVEPVPVPGPGVPKEAAPGHAGESPATPPRP